MTLPRGHYCWPILTTSEDKHSLEELLQIGMAIPETDLAAAFGCYQVEAFATANDRDQACGATALAAIQYYSVGRRELMRAGRRLSDIACGYSLEHPRFEQIVGIISDDAIGRLHKQARRALGKCDSSGEISSVTVCIARVQYKLSIVNTSGWLHFDVDAFWGLEPQSTGLVERTMAFLERRLLHGIAPMHPNVRSQ